MAPAKPGQRIRDVITAKAWNELHRKEKKNSLQETNNPQYPNIKVNGFDNNTVVLPRFSLVALANPLVSPTAGMTDDNDPAFDQLDFQLSRSVNSTSSIGITQSPCGYNLECKVVIYGMTWARVNITDPSGSWADIDTGNRLKTAATGSIKILWKPSGLGIKQCLVLLGSGSKSSGSGGICYLTSALSARTDSPNKLGQATAQKVVVDSGGNILGYETATLLVFNTTKVTQAAGTLCQYKEPSPGLFLVDVGDCSVLTTTIVPVNPVPSGATGADNTMQITPSYGIGI